MTPRLLERWQRLTLRAQLLAAVNGAIIVFLAAYLAIDYHNQWDSRLEAKHAALQQEAETLMPALVMLGEQDLAIMQDHIDDVCARMEGYYAPSHHIIVTLGETVLQAHSHHRASAHMLDVARITDAGPGRTRHDGGEYLVASAQEGDIKAFVIDSLDDIAHSLRTQLLWRSGGLLGLCILGAAAVNVLLLRLVNRPLDTVIQAIRQVGGGDFGKRVVVRSNADLAFLADEVNKMSGQLAAAHREQAQQLSKARRIQQHLLPGHTSIPGLNLAARHQAATEVGGDYYDLLEAPDGRWWLCVADVTGHGVPAAMGASQLKALITVAISQAEEPAGVLALMNYWYTSVSLPEDFASVWLGRWDPERGLMEYASAGHEPAYLLNHGGSSDVLPSTGLVLGIREEARWETQTIAMNPGDRLCVCTDGLTEARDPDGAMFGRERLYREIADLRPSSLNDAVTRLLEQVWIHLDKEHAQDDITCLLMERTAP